MLLYELFSRVLYLYVAPGCAGRAVRAAPLSPPVSALRVPILGPSRGPALRARLRRAALGPPLGWPGAAHQAEVRAPGATQVPCAFISAGQARHWALPRGVSRPHLFFQTVFLIVSPFVDFN